MMLINLTGTGRTGKELENLLVRANVTVNKNTVPFETLSPFVTSGVRVGTPAVTSRGMKEPEMEKIAGFIALLAEKGEDAIPEVKAQVISLCEKYPLYEGGTID
jgi:glycine hydroxymethyltransferase